VLTENPDCTVVAVGLCKIYQMGSSEIEVLRDVSFSVKKGSFVALCGPSGSGKTTLLNLISGIDKPTGGQIEVLGQNVNELDEDLLAEFRCNELGFVFQSYNLVSTLTVSENVAFPMEWRRRSEKEITKRVTELLEMVGLGQRANHFPAQLSGGEQQRVAFARALANDPRLFLADEPTGNLDTKNGEKITEILQILKSMGKTVIVSTHDAEIVRLADQKICLEDGKLVSQNE
jgi:putative ABC transport system ATP-binding protein